MSSQATSHSPLATDSDEVLVRVEGVSKKFCRSLKRSLWYGICDIGAELNPFRRQAPEVAGSGLRVAGSGSNPNSSEPATSYSQPVTDEAGLRPGEFYAVRDVSFELRRGECLGLIGHNGAGKTTLLKMLNGLIKPDTGRIEMSGRVGALIALGAGFNPILTGRENIYINGSVLGLSKKEIDGKIDEIIDFAEIDEFVDAPVQNYSSGMQVRLGFAIATALEPDILILDEILAVGDAQFRSKCYNKIAAIRDKSAVIFVSHYMEQVGRICDRASVMQAGAMLTHKSVEAAIDHYERIAESTNSGEGCFCKTVSPLSELRVAIDKTDAYWNQPLGINISLGLMRQVRGLTFRVVLYNTAGAWVADSANDIKNDEVIASGSHEFHYALAALPLKAADYLITVHVIDSKGSIIGWAHKQARVRVLGRNRWNSAECRIDGSVCRGAKLNAATTKAMPK